MSQKGFTLVEIAIVMVIISLMISAVIKGSEMIESAKVTATISQVRSYQAAMLTFQDTYNAMPGDMRNATKYLPGCNSSTMCLNGNGDYVLGHSLGANAYVYSQSMDATLPAVETSMFWKHLLLADLITGVTTNADPTTSAWGETHPAAKIGGGFHVFYSIQGGDMGSGIVLRLQNAIEGPASIGIGQNPISPLRAEQLDRKIDNNEPDTGAVQADYHSTNCDRDGDYVNTKSRNCIMYFTMQ